MINPAANIRAPKTEKPLPKALTADEMSRFFSRNSKAGKRDLAIYELLYSSGLRVSELTSLKLQDLDLGNGWVRVIGKGNKERYVPVGSRATTALNEYLPLRAVVEFRCKSIFNTEALFLNSRGGPLSSRSVARILKSSAVCAGLAKNVSPHAFRHSFATHMLYRRSRLAINPGAAGPCESFHHSTLHQGRSGETHGGLRQIASEKRSYAENDFCRQSIG